MPFLAPPDFKPITTGLVGNPAQIQGTPVLKFGTNVFTTIGAINDSATLPAALGTGRPILVVNFGANQMQVFPAVGEQIDGIAINGSRQVFASSCCMFTDAQLGRWTSLRG